MQHLVCTMKNYYVNDSDKRSLFIITLHRRFSLVFSANMERKTARKLLLSWQRLSSRPQVIFSNLIKRMERLLNKNHGQMEMEAAWMDQG